MLHTLPNVSYLARVRNTDEIIHDKKEESTVGGEEKKDMEHKDGGK